MDIAEHEDDSVMQSINHRQMLDERCDNLNGLSFYGRDPGSIEVQPGNSLVFIIPGRIISICSTELICDYGDTASGEDLHHHGGAGAWKAGDDNDGFAE